MTSLVVNWSTSYASDIQIMPTRDRISVLQLRRSVIVVVLKSKCDEWSYWSPTNQINFIRENKEE